MCIFDLAYKIEAYNLCSVHAARPKNEKAKNFLLYLFWVKFMQAYFDIITIGLL